jgi:hypothetical protein
MVIKVRFNPNEGMTMLNRTFKTAALGVALSSALLAQMTQQRQATLVGGGSADRGKCTIEVVVDDVAQVEVSGPYATLRTLSGRPSQWRRFECTSPMPQNPAAFRFAGVDGRGRQTLVRDPRNGGPAVVQIEDKQGGTEGYTFDMFWDPRGSGGSPSAYGGGYEAPNRGSGVTNQREDYYRDDTYRDGYRDSDYYRHFGHGFSVDDAVRVCQQAVSEEASRRFRTNDIHFHRTKADDGPGRQDWVSGMLDVHRGPVEEHYRFSCSMDFNAGRLRTVQLDERPY